MDTKAIHRRTVDQDGQSRLAPHSGPAEIAPQPTHVDALLSVALHGPADFDPGRFPGWAVPAAEGLLPAGEELSAENASGVGAALLAGCIAGGAHRGLAAPADPPLAGAASADPDSYEFTDLGRVLSIPESLKALAYLEVCSCDDPTWPESPARAFCGALLWRLISTLPGFQDAPWEVSATDLISACGALRVA